MKDLRSRLEDLLTQTTTLAELQLLYDSKPNFYCPYLRVKQKPLDIKEWMPGGKYHNGAHFPLCIFTKNVGARSEEAAKQRAKKFRGKGKDKGKDKKGTTAVAESNGKGQGTSQ